MSTIRTLHHSIDIHASPETVYRRWRALTDFPELMDGVNSVSSFCEGMERTAWTVQVGQHTVAFHAQIVEEIPGQRIAWKSVRGPSHAGVATFHRISDSKSRMIVEMDYEVGGWLELLGDALGVPSRFVERNLELFKASVEDEARPPLNALQKAQPTPPMTGAWA